MEEIYILSDGSQVDISNFSDFEKVSFLSKNPKAKKQKGVAKSAIVTSKKPQAQSGESAQVDGSLESKKYRLPTESDYGAMQNRGILPPPSATPKSTANVEDLYGSKQNQDFNDLKKLLNPTVDKNFNERVKNIAVKKKTKTSDIYDLKADSTEHIDIESEVAGIKDKIRSTDAELTHPYLYYSSKNQESLKPVEEQQVEDDFIERNYKVKELEGFGINPQDFDGYLNKKGYKDDFKKKEAEGLFTGEGRNLGGYDIGLARELARKKMLLMYMDEMKSRDVNRQDLNQDLEIVQGVRDKKEIINNDIFDPNGMAKYVENYFPTITKKLKDKDKENAKVYEESKKGGTDFFSWDTAEKIGRASWSAVIDRTAQMTASGYEALGMKGTAEGIRMLDEENKFIRRDDRGISYVSGKTVTHDGTKYIVDSKGQIYDAEAKIRVTDLFNEPLQKKLVEEAKYGPSDWTFSTQGAAVQTSGVMADMLLQAAITRGVGKLGTAAGEIRYASNVAKPASGFTSLLNDSSKLLKKVPLERATGYSMIAQGTMGYAQGYEDTLKAARDNGINDKDAFELANAAGQRMAVLYGTTGVINPQTKVVENIFGSKNIVEKAIEQYTKTGKTGFVSYIDDIIKNAPKNLVEFAEEGGKEVVQENIQQVGEVGVNMMTNKDAGKKIMNEVMSGDDFMNTSILSFISSGLISKAKLPNFNSGDQNTDNLASLSTLAKNKTEFTKIIDGLVGQKVFTTEQADNLKKDVKIYADNVNKLPKSISPNVAMPVMVELDKVSKLLDEKETTDKAFHPEIDEKINIIRENISKIQVEETLKAKNKTIIKALEKGIVKNTEFKTFKDTQQLEQYLIDTYNMSPKDAKFNASNKGMFVNSQYLNDVSGGGVEIPEGKKFIFINEDIASKRGDFSVGQHEFLHTLIHETLKDDPEAKKLLGTALTKELLKIQELITSEGKEDIVVPKEYAQKFGRYVRFYEEANNNLLDDIDDYYNSYREGKITKEEYDSKKSDIQKEIDSNIGDKWEETLTLYSDAISQGIVKYDEGTMTRLKDTLRQVLQYLGIKDIKFESGKDVYNFLKDYNKSVESGNWGVGMRKLGKSKAEVNKESLRKETGTKEPVKKVQEQTNVSKPKFSLAPDRKSSEDIKKDVNKGYDKEKWSSGTNDKGENRAIDRVLYDILNEYEYIIKGKAKGLGYSNLPDYSEMDMISETQLELMPHIRNFNKEFFQKREEYKKELLDSGLKPESKEFKDKVEAQDQKGYKGKKGIVKENDDLNAWINSQLVNKMGNALRSGNVTTQKFTEDIDNEMFKETKIIDGYGGEEGYLMDEGNNIFDAEQDYAEEQNRLAVLLKDPVYNFVDEQGKPIDIETVPFGSFFITEATDPSIAANRKLKTETDPVKIAELKKELKDLERGLELQEKKDITYEEKEELKSLKSFKSYDLSTGMMVNTFKALSIEDTPAKIITDEVGREILRSPNIETLEYRNFKEKLSTLSKTMARRMTFKNGPEIESLMYREWKLLYDVINNPVDPVTGESSYASKKLPPRLKEFDEKGNLRKIGDITRVKFLQSYYGIDEASRIIKTYGGTSAEKQIAKLEEPELSEKDKGPLRPTTYFDRRTALMELFGDVLVLQEARRLIRQPDFLDKVSERNVNLYNELKNEVTRAKVLNNMAKGKSSVVKFSLAETKKDIDYKNKFKNLINSKEYTRFNNSIKNQQLYHFGSEAIEGTIEKDEERTIWFYVDLQGAENMQYSDINGEKVFQPLYGNGDIYKTTIADLPGAIVIPDIELATTAWHKKINEKFPETVEQIKLNYKKGLSKRDTEIRSFKDANGKEIYIFSFRDILNSGNADNILLEWMKFVQEEENLDYGTALSQEEGIYEGDKVTSGLEVIVFGKMDTQNEVKKLRKDGKFKTIKFSLAEEENGRLSNFLEGLPFTEQWVVARDIDKAILKGKTAEGKDVAFKVPSMSKSTDKATAYFIISKVAEGYNNFEFKVKKNANGPLTKQVLDALDFKSAQVQETMRLNNNLEQGMNEIIEQNKGVEASETFSPETAKNLGKNIDSNKIFLPPEDEDFLGLLYTLGSGRGKQGEKQMKFLVDNLLKPYSNAMLNLMKARQTMYKDWRSLINTKYKGISKELKQDSGYGGYLVDQAVRVYLWKKAGYEIPGLDNKDLFHLLQIVRNNPRLRNFADDVSYLSKQANGYVEPGHNWGFGSVVGDINNIISKSNRVKFLEQWQGNTDKIFSKNNMSKIEALYGRKYVKALENMLYRMKTGSNRAEGSSDSLLNWINGSTAVTMFFNIRSALLQTLGGINYINTSDNNVIKAGAALLNVPQYTKDFFTIWNSDYAKDRRSGLMNDVAEAEFAQLMNDPRNNSLMDKFKAANYWLLKNGFGPTRIMDSFAISFGGAGFYRNRLKTYLKEGMSEEDAKKATMRDFYETSEISQQSADVSKISMNQASTKGRILLSFMNTPFQYSRIIKKSTIDLIKGRGSAANNIAKIVYYSTIQNMMFNFLQNAMFSMFWDDDDEQAESKFNTAQFRTINGALDTLIRGTGLKGVLLASVKNAIVKWYEKSGDPKGYGDVLLELANVSPSIGIKLRAMTKSYKAVEYNKDEIMYKGFSLDNNYALEAITSLTSATLNFPADRLYTKINNVKDALNSEYETWQRIAFIFGYNKYNLGLGETEEEDSGRELKMPGLKEGELKMPELK